MANKKKKLAAPIIVTVFMLMYFGLYFGILITELGGVLKYAFGIIPLAFSIVMVKVCLERIKEIKKGEDDDIGKY